MNTPYDYFDRVLGVAFYQGWELEYRSWEEALRSSVESLTASDEAVSALRQARAFFDLGLTSEGLETYMDRLGVTWCVPAGVGTPSDFLQFIIELLEGRIGQGR